MKPYQVFLLRPKHKGTCEGSWGVDLVVVVVVVVVVGQQLEITNGGARWMDGKRRKVRQSELLVYLSTVIKLL